MRDTTKGNNDGMDVNEEDKTEDVSLFNVNFDIEGIAMDVREDRKSVV